MHSSLAIVMEKYSNKYWMHCYYMHWIFVCLLQKQKSITRHCILANEHYWKYSKHVHFYFISSFQLSFLLSLSTTMVEIVAYKIEDVHLICLTNKKWLFLLLREYPMIARHWFHGGNLPLHLATKNKCWFQIIARLIETWPESLQVQNNDGKLPLHIAILHLSSFRSLQIIIVTYPKGLSYNLTKLPLHDAVARHWPLDVRIIQRMIRRNQDSVM